MSSTTRAVGVLLLSSCVSLLVPADARAMCGCMVRIRPPRPTPNQDIVAQKLLNRASKVVLVRDGETTILTMSNDVITELDEFGLVVPVPTVIGEKDVRIVDPMVFGALERMTNPKLVEMYDPEPCPSEVALSGGGARAMAPEASVASKRKAPRRAADYGVKVEAHYDVGEYSIAVLSAKEGAGQGLMTWLNKFHYEVPQAAIPVLDSYIKQSMRFFVAKVNFKQVKGHERSTFLRPIQVRYETPRFMLPVRLGTINADGPQELVAYAFSPKGRIEATNYRTVRLPTGQDLPLYVKGEFEKVYAGIFDAQTKKEDMRAIFLEHVRRGGLDPSTTDKVGLGWGTKEKQAFDHFTLSRLHFRYDRDHFPEDLVLQETADVEPFQISYNIHHPASNVQCADGAAYLKTLPLRRSQEADALASLTAWDVKEIREKMGIMIPAEGTPQPEQNPPEGKAKEKEPFWKRLFE